MQAVVSQGANPLPAEVRLKYHGQDSDSFYGLDQAMWVADRAELKVYKHSTQAKVRRLFEEVAIATFAGFKYKHEATAGLYVPHFGKPHEEVLLDIIKFIETLISADTALSHAVQQIGVGRIAELCLDLTHTFRAGKNWNSHGAAVGAATCSIASILAALDSGVLPNYHQQTGIRGVQLGGQRHGSHHTHYVEYMCSQPENCSILGVRDNFLEHGNFRRKRHDIIVRQIFNEKLPTIDYPMPRPVRGHTVDFAACYLGTHVLDGECKDCATNRGPASAVLVLHSLQQLTYRDVALALLTSSSHFTLYSSTINIDNGRVNTTFTEFGWYVLTHPKDLTYDEFAGKTKPAGYNTKLQGKGSQKYVKVAESGGTHQANWDSLRSGPQQFLFMLFQVIDALVVKFDDINLDGMRYMRGLSYDKGFVEPSYWSTKEGMVKSGRCPDQSKYKYCSKTMEARGVGATSATIQRNLLENYRFVLDNYSEILSEEVVSAIEEGMALHQPKNE